MSLVELMVGIAVGLITVLVVMSTLSVSEGMRRGTSSGADAQVSATVASYLVQRDARMAGYGIFSSEANSITRLCTTGVVRMYNEDHDPPEFDFDASLALAPILINPAGLPAGDAETDIVVVNYTGVSLGSVGRGIPFQQQSGASANYKVENRAGFRTGDLVMAVQPGKDCSVAEITGLPGSPKCSEPGSQTEVVIHNNGQYNNSYKDCAKVDSKWNKPGGLGVTYTDGLLYSLGPPEGMVSVAYAVRNGRLTSCNVIGQDCADAAKVGDPNVWQPIADDIVLLRAEFGLDTDANNSIDTWRASVCAGVACVPTFDDWAQLRLLRLAVVARSPQLEREEVTAQEPLWQGASALKVSHLEDWKKYRYATIESAIPLRNLIWGN